LASAGETGQAIDYAQRALARAEQSDRLGESLAHRTLARINSQDPAQHAVALVHLDKALSSARSRRSTRDVALTELAIARFHAARGDQEQAAPALAAARKTFTQLGMDHYEREADELL
jgi:hypothetical protein